MNKKIILENIVLNTVPSEKIFFDGCKLELNVDDVNEESYKLVFLPFQALKIRTIDCVDIFEYFCEDCKYDGVYHRNIFEIVGSNWIEELKLQLKNNDEQANFLENAKHYMITTDSNIIEVISTGIMVEKLTK